MEAISSLLLPLGLGLLGFIEPCSVGSSLLFLRLVEGRPAATTVMQAVVFTLTRAVVVGLLGAAAALVGTAFLGFQRAAWVGLGALYAVLGVVYLTGNAGRLMRSLGPSLGRLSAARSAAGLAVLFGLNIPACAAPLLAAVLGSAAVGGTAHVAQGFFTLALFGLALSLPLTLALLWAPARRVLDRLAAMSDRVPVAIGLLLAVFGAWSIYLVHVPARGGARRLRRALDWLSPASLAGRTVLALFAGLLGRRDGDDQDGPGRGGLPFRQRVAARARRARRDGGGTRGPGGRAHLRRGARGRRPARGGTRSGRARVLVSPGFELTWGRSAPADALDEAALAPLRARLRQRAPELADLRIGYAPAAPGEARLIRGGVRLADGSWVAFAASGLEAASVPTHATLASLSAMALGIVLASLLVVRWITNPLRRLAKAAEDFGKGGAPVPLAEDGPREVRDAARTFNAMQARIHRLVADRTQALAAVSHDLRTPIQRLRLRAGFLEDAEAQQAIDADLDEMEGMVEATLAYLRGETEGEEPRQADLAAILRTLCDAAADREAAVTYAGPDHVRLRLRPVAVKRALANLIDNAVKYGGGGARVVLEDGPDAAAVRVEDDGPGIPEEALEAVLEPFQRLEGSRNRSTGGTGLGLTIARQVVQGHGGSLTLANRPCGGLVVSVRLPRAGAPKCGGDAG